MTRSERIADALMRPINPAVIVILGIYTIVWGLWLMNPFWTVFTQAPLYSAMASIFAEWIWGAIAVTAGVVIAYGAWKPSYENVRRGSFTAALHWLVISILYFLGDVHNTGGITSLAFAVYAGVIWVNTKVNRAIYPNNGS